MNNISILVGLKNNLDYSKHFYKTTRALYPKIELCFVSYGSTDGTHEWLESLNDPNLKYFYSTKNKTFSDTFNKAAELSTKEYVMYSHNDIVLTPNFIENIEKYIGPNNIVSYTNIEPPIFAGHERPGKIIKDLGVDLKTFNLKELYEFASQKQDEFKDKNIEDISFFMCIPKDIYFKMNGLDNLYDPMFCEDIDLCVRLKLLGMKFIMSLDAISYHFVSKTSRFSDEYKTKTALIERNSNLNFIRKWGCLVKPIEMLDPIKYNISYIVKNCNLQLLEILEPWCDKIYIDDKNICFEYINKEQINTKYNLSEKVLDKSKIDKNDIIVEFNATQLNQNNFQILQQLPDIIKESGEIGLFELDIFKVTINNINPQNLIICHGS
jgi:GT2 family glycosyltransferase